MVGSKWRGASLEQVVGSISCVAGHEALTAARPHTRPDLVRRRKVRVACRVIRVILAVTVTSLHVSSLGHVSHVTDPTHLLRPVTEVTPE